mgnify:CR=1 FL=1
MDTFGDIDAAIDAVARRNPAIDRVANRDRLAGTLALELFDPASPDAALGDVDPVGLGEVARLIAEAKGSARQPALDDVFDGRFLPDPAARARNHAVTA